MTCIVIAIIQTIVMYLRSLHTFITIQVFVALCAGTNHTCKKHWHFMPVFEYYSCKWVRVFRCVWAWNRHTLCRCSSFIIADRGWCHRYLLARMLGMTTIYPTGSTIASMYQAFRYTNLLMIGQFWIFNFGSVSVLVKTAISIRFRFLKYFF